MALKAAADRLIPVDVQNAVRTFLISAVTVDKTCWEPVIHVVVRHKQRMNAAEIQIMQRRVIKRIRWKVDQKLSVEQHL